MAWNRKLRTLNWNRSPLAFDRIWISILSLRLTSDNMASTEYFLLPSLSLLDTLFALERLSCTSINSASARRIHSKLAQAIQKLIPITM